MTWSRNLYSRTGSKEKKKKSRKEGKTERSRARGNRLYNVFCVYISMVWCRQWTIRREWTMGAVASIRADLIARELQVELAADDLGGSGPCASEGRRLGAC